MMDAWWRDPSKQLRDRKRLNVTHKKAVTKAEAVLERRAAGRNHDAQRFGATTRPTVSERSPTFISLPTVLKTIVAEKLDARSLGNFAAASTECQSAAHDELRAALIVAVRQSLAPVPGRLPWGKRAISVALVSDALVACPYFRLPDELVPAHVKKQAIWPAGTARAADWLRLAGACVRASRDLALKGASEALAGRSREPAVFLTQVSIPHGAFYHCTSLRKITFPARLTIIGISAFEGCTSLHELNLPAALTTINDFAFACCYVDNKVAQTSDQLRTSSPSGGLKRPLSVLEHALGCPKLRSASANQLFGPRWPAIYRLFSTQACCTSLTKLTLPTTLTTISAVAFAHNTSLREVALPAALTTIGCHAFARCTALNQIAFPATLTTIEHRAFHGCISLGTKPPLPAALLKRHTTWVGQRPRGCSSTAFDGCSFAARVPFLGTFRGLCGWLHRRNLTLSSRGSGVSVAPKVSLEEAACFARLRAF